MSSESHTHHGHGEDEHHAHALPIKLLVGVWAALMFLTWLTVYVAGLDLGEIDFVVAMAIATVKVSLVCLVFMHLLWDKGFHSVLVGAGILFLFLFLGTALFDRAHYQATIDAHERDHPTERRFPVLEHAGHGDSHGDADADHSGEGETEGGGEAGEH